MSSRVGVRIGLVWFSKDFAKSADFFLNAIDKCEIKVVKSDVKLKAIMKESKIGTFSPIVGVISIPCS